MFLSEHGSSLGLATHLSSEGHSVTFYTDNESLLGHGIVDIAGPDSEFNAADIYCYDHNRFSKDADQARKEGLRVLGASNWAGLIDSNKEYQDDLIKLAGWKRPATLSGANLYVTLWFNGDRYISVYNSLVYRRFMSGGAGPDLNCVGMLANFDTPTNRVSAEIMQPLERILKRVNHRGCFHVHGLVKDNQLSVSEVSAQFTHPLSYLLFENSNVSVSEVLLRLFNESSQPIKHLESWASGALLSVPPYPYDITHKPVELKGVQPANLKHLWLNDAQKINGQWYTAACNGQIGFVTARGSTPEEAVRRMYRTVRNLEIRDLQYRNDIGRNMSPVLESLRHQGWLR